MLFALSRLFILVLTNPKQQTFLFKLIVVCLTKIVSHTKIFAKMYNICCRVFRATMRLNNLILTGFIHSIYPSLRPQLWGNFLLKTSAKKKWNWSQRIEYRLFSVLIKTHTNKKVFNDCSKPGTTSYTY